MATYQDYVIKDGQLVADFNGLYRDFEDPWHQSRSDHLHDTRRQVAISWCERLRSIEGSEKVSRVVEVGCGFGFMTNRLREMGFASVGVDIAENAIDLARSKNPASTFMVYGIENEGLLRDLDPDIVVMAEVTWYVLDHLAGFTARLRDFASQRERPTYLIHLLTTYAPGVQKYGREFFTDLDGILNFFELEYLEAGFVRTPRGDDPLSQGTYFVARVPRQQFA